MPPPQGWTDKESLLDKPLWDGKIGDLKWALEIDYGLKDAKPIWTRNPEYGDALFIFEASPPNVIEKSFFVWNALAFTVFRFDLKKLEEIEKAITKLGGGQGNLGELKLLPVKPLK